MTRRRETVHEESGLRLNKPGNLGTSDYRITCVIAILPSREISQLPTAAVPLCRSYRCFVIMPEEVKTGFRITGRPSDVFGPLLRPRRHWNTGGTRAGNYFQSRRDVTPWRNDSRSRNGIPQFLCSLWHWTYNLYSRITTRRDWPGNVTSWRNIPVSSVVSPVSTSERRSLLRNTVKLTEITWTDGWELSSILSIWVACDCQYMYNISNTLLQI